MDATKKLFRVTLRGMLSPVTGPAYGDSYVVATDPTSAYDVVRKFLDKNDIGFPRDREMDKVELVAGTDRYNDAGHILFAQEGAE